MPIEVTSDTLEVFQQDNKAMFSGHVVAIQGDVRLKADTMTIYYRKQNTPSAHKTKAKETNSDATGAIIRIDADGKVFLSTPEETASGDKGIYDVEHHVIHLNDNVMLTKGKNVLKGDRLTYNFDTQQSVLTGGDGTPMTATGKTGSQRVHALFVPEGGDEKGTNKK